MRHHQNFLAYSAMIGIVALVGYFGYEATRYMMADLPWLVPTLGVLLALCVIGSLCFMVLSHAHAYHTLTHRHFEDAPVKKVTTRKSATTLQKLPPMRHSGGWFDRLKLWWRGEPYYSEEVK